MSFCLWNTVAKGHSFDFTTRSSELKKDFMRKHAVIDMYGDTTAGPDDISYAILSHLGEMNVISFGFI